MSDRKEGNVMGRFVVSLFRDFKVIPCLGRYDKVIIITMTGVLRTWKNDG